MRAASGATPLGRFVHAARDPKIRVMIDRLMLVLRFIGTSFLSLIRRGSCQEYDDFRLHTWLNREVGTKLIDKRVFSLDAVSASSFQQRSRVVRDQTDCRTTQGAGDIIPLAWFLHGSRPLISPKWSRFLHPAGFTRNRPRLQSCGSRWFALGRPGSRLPEDSMGPRAAEQAHHPSSSSRSCHLRCSESRWGDPSPLRS